MSNSKTFDFVILFFIGLNCITLAMERPLIPPHSVVRHSRSRFINDFLKMLNNKFFIFIAIIDFFISIVFVVNKAVQ